LLIKRLKDTLFAFGFFLPFVIIACFSIYLNPYEVFRDTHHKGIKDSPSRLKTTFSISHRKPKGLILGSSTAGSLDTDHPGWNPDAKPIIYANNSYTIDLFRKSELSLDFLRKSELSLTQLPPNGAVATFFKRPVSSKLCFETGLFTFSI